MKKIPQIILIIIFSVALASSCKVGKSMNLHKSNANTFIVDDKKPKVSGTNEDSCDMIILRNGEEISAKVLEIGIHEIKFKKCDNLNGPTISILKNDVFMIKYSNGTKEVMKSTDNFSTDNSDKTATIPCNINANTFDIGIEGSPSLIYLRGLIDYNYEPSLGFSGGISFQYNFPKIISIRTNVSFERKGAIRRITYTDIMGETISELVEHSNFNYITLPILIKASLGKHVKYFITAGAFGGYLLNAEINYNIQVTTNSGD
ncbi:MAG TPA: porin family protein, partial [Bacteroidales bacterium]|nr:porin family protein [Bacteroidales bacterium]